MTLQSKEILLNQFLSDIHSISDNYFGITEENEAFDKLLQLIRFLYTIDPNIFDESVVEKIERAKEKISEKKENKPQLGTLPFKVGETYRDRNQSYVVERLNGTDMWVKYEDGTIEEVDLTTSIKKRIYENILDDHTNGDTIRRIARARIEERAVNLWIRNFKRESHCYSCSTNVNISCEFCYVCGWFICKRCSACGCGFDRAY